MGDIEKSETECPKNVLEAIYGTQKNKEQIYEESLKNWWKEYAARKNDEEEEHVADSLMYDERCTLPRTITKPEFQSNKKT